MHVSFGAANILKQFHSARIYFSGGDGGEQCAIRFMGVAAIMKAALSEIRRELDEAGFDLTQTQMMQAEHLYAGAVNQIAFGIEMIQTRMRGGVLAGIEHGGNFARGGFCFGQQAVDERGLAHAGLPDQYAGVALQEGAQRRGIL